MHGEELSQRVVRVALAVSTPLIPQVLSARGAILGAEKHHGE